MVYFDDGIIDDDFVAWVHGPVCVVVYNEYKTFGFSPLSIEYNGSDPSDYIESFIGGHSDVENFKAKVDLINAVLQKYMPFTSLQLELLSHSEYPWKEARIGLSPIDKGTTVINNKTIKEYYQELLNA